jgi:tRNA-intron endonuclease
MKSTQTEKGIETGQGGERRRAEAVLMEKDTVVSDQSEIDAFSSRGYGKVENALLKLSAHETLFLLDRGLLDVRRKKVKKNLGFQEVLQYFRASDENVWVKYLIYRDLRSRGYVVRDGFGLGVDFRLYERGEYGKDVAEYIIYGIQEGKPVSMSELIDAVKHAQNSKKKLVLAVLNRRGEVVYYSLSQLAMK